MHAALSQAVFEAELRPLTDEYVVSQGWTVNAKSFPILDLTFSREGRTPLRLQFNCTDYDQQPVSVTLCAADGTRLTALPGGNGSGVFNSGPHPSTGYPFVCMRGTLEYHTHPSHLTDPWEPLRGTEAFKLLGIAFQLYLAWLKGTE